VLNHRSSSVPDAELLTPPCLCDIVSALAAQQLSSARRLLPPFLPRRSITLFLAAWLPILLITRTAPTVAHEWSRLGTVEGIVERYSFKLEESRFRNSADRILYDGHYYSHQPPVLPTLQAPVYWALRQFDLRFWNSAPFDLAYFLFTALTNGVALAGTIVVLDAVWRGFGVASGVSVCCAVALPLGTWLLPYGVVSNNHGVSAFLLACLAWLLMQIDFDRVEVRILGALGLTLGLLVAIEVIPIVSFVPLTIAVVLSRPGLRARAQLAAFFGGLALPLLLHAALNIPITGDLLPGGFHTELFVYEGTRFDASTLSGNMNHETSAMFLDYAWKALVTEKGYFSYAPILLAGLLIGITGWRSWSIARGVHVVMLGGALISLTASLLMTNNFGGVASGFRHATYLAVPLIVLTLPMFLSHLPVARVASRSLIGVALASAALLFAVIVPQPWYPYRFPPEGPSLLTWDRYVPAVAQAVRRLQGSTDEFGVPVVRGVAP
jgi:hypothetical protein